MSVLDTFYLLFKTDASGAKNEISALDKQIDELTTKGKKRNEQENNALKESIKRHKELTSQLKDQTKQVDELGSSFGKMISSGATALAGFATFGALKSGVLNAAQLNSSLEVTARITGQNAGEMRAYSAALEAAGGNAQDLMGYINWAFNEASSRRIPLPQTGVLLTRIHDQIKGKSPAEQAKILQLNNAMSLAPLLEQPDEEFNKNIAKMKAHEEATNKNADASRKFEEQTSNLKSTFVDLFSYISGFALPVLTDLEKKIEGFVASNPNASTGIGIAGGLIALKSIGNLLRVIGGIGAVAIGGGALITGLSAVIAGISAAPYATAFGDKIGTAIKNYRNTGSRQQVIDFWKSQGYSDSQAKGWAANAQAESGFNPMAIKGSHRGLYQWSKSRRDKIMKAIGIDVWNASMQDQLKAAAWEASAMGISPSSVPIESGAAAGFVSNHFEVPSLTSLGLAAEANKRAGIARSYGTSAGGGSKTVNVKIDDVTVNTNATNSQEMAQGASSALQNHIRISMSNLDDGEFA